MQPNCSTGRLSGISQYWPCCPFGDIAWDKAIKANLAPLVSNPDLLLLDEPFSALDISTRQQLRENVLALKQELAIPIILITHDLEEAALLGDQIVALEQGKTDTGWLARMEKIVAKKDLRSVTGRSRCGKCCKPDNFMISQGAAQIGGQSSHVSG